MIKTKRILSIGLAFLFGLGCITACQGMDDITPEKYGEWDNHYIYRGNGKSKTTGEDYEQLVTTVEMDEKKYDVLACVDCKIEADDMYMILACQEAGKALPSDGYVKEYWAKDLEKVYCFVVYNIETQTQKVLSAEQTVILDGTEYFYRPTDIEGIFDDCILLRAYVQERERMQEQLSLNTYDWYALDFDGNVINPSVSYASAWEWVSNEYLLAEIYNKETQCNELYYRTSELSEPIFISQDYSDYAYVEQDGVKGVLLQEYVRDTSKYNEKIFQTIKFYNFATKTMSNSISISKYARFYSEYRYVKTYDYKTIEYNAARWERKTAEVECNNAIYRLVYDENGIRLEDFFDLAEGHRFDIYGIVGDKIVYQDRWYENPRGCDFYGGSVYKDYEYDTQSRNRKELTADETRALEDEYAAVYEQEQGIAVGDYIYFLHKEAISAFMSSTTHAYMLKRRNVKTGALDVMQLWHQDDYREDNENSEYRKYCKALWFTCGDWSEFDFYEFTIRAY